MSGIRTVRLRALDWIHYASQPTHWLCWTIKFYTGVGQTGTEFATGKTAYASQAAYYGTPSSATDNNNGTYWGNAPCEASYPIWGIDLGSNNVNLLRSVAIYAHASIYGLYMPKSFVIEISRGDKDSSAWVEIGRYTTTNTTSPLWLYYNINFNYFQNPVIPNIIVY